ncbi:uncharacterized protein LOC110626691 [Manihot esculenta]|uniref:uncharacterized protein LOC110626691 n=1 Tax=Manihot esculenta TaxID=3983 RepID=UPI000B5D7155|nr:uncharacterized protein LOC110626691 [Manihot esculenta]
MAKAKRAQLQALRVEFETLCMQGGKFGQDAMMAIANKMRIHGKTLADVTIIEKILRSMIAKFNYVEEVALKAITLPKSGDYEKGKWKGKNVNNKKEKNKAGDSHNKAECRTNLNKNYGGKSNFTETREDIESKAKEEVTLLMACTSKNKASIKLWYLDTGCSNHMCRSKMAFSELYETYQDTVRFGDDFIIFVMGKGKVQVVTKANSIHTIGNVFYAPALQTNLLSAGQLLEKGYKIHFKGDICEIRDAHWD